MGNISDDGFGGGVGVFQLIGDNASGDPVQQITTLIIAMQKNCRLYFCISVTIIKIITTFLVVHERYTSVVHIYMLHVRARLCDTVEV